MSRCSTKFRSAFQPAGYRYATVGDLSSCRATYMFQAITQALINNAVSTSRASLYGCYLSYNFVLLFNAGNGQSAQLPLTRMRAICAYDNVQLEE